MKILLAEDEAQLNRVLTVAMQKKVAMMSTQF